MDEFGTPNENWRGKNIDVNLKPHHYNRCRNTILEPSQSVMKCRILMHASLVSQKNISSQKLLHNTCAFDSIFQIYATCYLDCQAFKKYVHLFLNENDFFQLVEKFCNWDEMNNMIKNRLDLLYNVFESKVTLSRKIAELDCWMSVIDMFIALCDKNEALYSIKEKKRCQSCYNHSKKSRTSLPMKCHGLNLSNFGASLRVNVSKQCKLCNVEIDVKINRRFNPVIVIDLDGMEDPKIAIEKIQQTIDLNGKQYDLKGIISTTGTHFFSYIIRPDENWYTFDDMSPSQPQKMSAFVRIPRPVLLVYCISDCDDTNVEIENTISLSEAQAVAKYN